jgi:hypothetical protein
MAEAEVTKANAQADAVVKRVRACKEIIIKSSKREGGRKAT